MDTCEVLLLTISGQDKPGLTSTITQILSDYDVNILDIGQAVIHNSLSLGMLLEVRDANTSNIIKEVLFKAYDLDIKVKFLPVSKKRYSKWVQAQGKGRYIVSILSRKISSKEIAAVSQIIYENGLNIDIINRLTGRVPMDADTENSRACVEFSVRGTPLDMETMKSAFYNLSQRFDADISFQHDDVFRRNRRLVCFDMDSTLIQTECIVELAKAHRVGEKVRKITESAMEGEIDFRESFKRRVALLEGLDESVMAEIADNLPITEGAERLISTLKEFGYKIAVLSGGFMYFGHYLQKKLGIDYVYANDLEILDGKLTGKHLGEIVDGEKKAQLLRLIAQMENIRLEQVIAVGDGANDLPMINQAGLGIAYHAKPIVQKNAKHAISTVGLDGILYLLGYRDRHINIG